MKIEPEYGSASVVLLGSFNPRIFNPDWLNLHKLVSEAEKNDSEINIIHEDVASMRIGTKNIHIEQSRFSIDSTEAPFVALADFVGSLFGTVLPQTPVSRLGMNRIVHFRAPSEEARNKVGRLLAPLEPWGEWGEEIASKPPAARGGARTIIMQNARHEDNIRGGTSANIQPSVLPVLGNSGVYVAINDDYCIVEEKQEIVSAKLLALLADRFDHSMQLADRIIDHMMTLCLEAA